MHVGCLGRPLRPPRWSSRRTRWRHLLQASEVLVLQKVVLIAGYVGVEHLRRSAPDGVTDGPGMRAVLGSPAPVSTSPEGTSQRRTEVGDHPMPADAIGRRQYPR
jgi:hypothetical protein